MRQRWIALPGRLTERAAVAEHRCRPRKMDGRDFLLVTLLHLTHSPDNIKLWPCFESESVIYTGAMIQLSQRDIFSNFILHFNSGNVLSAYVFVISAVLRLHCHHQYFAMKICCKKGFVIASPENRKLRLKINPTGLRQKHRISQ